MFRTSLIVGACAMACMSAAGAQSLKPVTTKQELQDWQCMSLASVYGAQGSYSPPAPVYAGPESAAPQVGTGAGVIIVPKSIHPINGRTQMVWPNGRKVWINADQLVPWHSLNDPNAACKPALLSNGRYGFTTTP